MEPDDVTGIGAYLLGLYDGLDSEQVGKIGEYVGEVGLKWKTVIEAIKTYIYEHRSTKEAWVLSVSKDKSEAL